MKFNFIIMISFILLSQCSFLNSNSFYETFINPNISNSIEKIDENSDLSIPDLETVPKN